MSGRDQILQTMSEALRKQPGEEAELVTVAGEVHLSRCANSVIHQNVSSEDVLMVARVVRDGRVGCASAHGLSARTAAHALEQAGQLAAFAPKEEQFRGLPGPTPSASVRSHVEETGAVTARDRAGALTQVFAAAARHGFTVAGAYATRNQELAVMNTNGVAAYAPLSSATANLVVLGESSSGYACGMSRDVRDINLMAMGERAIQKCMDGANPVDTPPGDYEVILEPPAVAELMEWMTYTCFGARTIQEKTSALADHLGKPLMGENVTIYDDGTDPDGIPTPFDFEGQGKSRLGVIEHGVARGYGTDSVWAERLNTKNTAHGMMRSGEECDPIPMNLFIDPGDAAVEDMVGNVERGLLVTRFHYVNGFLDTRRALMTGMTRDGTFLIEDGKIKQSVGNLRFTESMVEALRHVKAISREREIIPSWWSEASNTGGLTMPALHLGRFHFTGKTEEA